MLGLRPHKGIEGVGNTCIHGDLDDVWDVVGRRKERVSEERQGTGGQ